MVESHPTNIYFLLSSIALCVLGVISFGWIGIVVAFWVLLFWYSVWSAPIRWEMLVLALTGVGGAIYFLPEDYQKSLSDGWMIAFILASFAPIGLRRLLAKSELAQGESDA